MFKVRGNGERAGRLFARAVEADPTHWHNQSRRANMLKKTGSYDDAERAYRAACDASANPTTLGNYANFLQLVRRDWEAAQTHYLAALKLDPQHKAVRRNYAAFLQEFPEAREQRNMSSVTDTPVAKALDRAVAQQRSGAVGVVGQAGSYSNGGKKSPMAKKGARKVPKHSPFRPRKLAPQLGSLAEGTPRSEAGGRRGGAEEGTAATAERAACQGVGTALVSAAGEGRIGGVLFLFCTGVASCPCCEAVHDLVGCDRSVPVDADACRAFRDTGARRNHSYVLRTIRPVPGGGG